MVSFANHSQARLFTRVLVFAIHCKMVIVAQNVVVLYMFLEVLPPPPNWFSAIELNRIRGKLSSGCR